MSSVRDIKRWLLAIVALLVVLDIAAVVLLYSPAGRSRRAREEERDNLQREYQTRVRELAPVRDMDKRLAIARTQIADFYKGHVPSRYSDISDDLGKLAAENHVEITAIRYDEKDTEIPSLNRVAISALVTGDYASQMRFINSLERDKAFFVINSINLGGGEGGQVRLDLHLETFLKTGA